MKPLSRLNRVLSLVLALTLLLGTLTAGLGIRDAAASTLGNGGTYFTDDDNWGGGPIDSAPDNDMNAEGVNNKNALHPFELKIKDVTAPPVQSAYLLVRAYDVDEYDPAGKAANPSLQSGEWDRIYMSSNPNDIALKIENAHTPWPTSGDWKNIGAKYKSEFPASAYIGALSGVDTKWSTTVLTINPEDFHKIVAGDMYVGMSIHHHYKDINGFNPMSGDNSNTNWVVKLDWVQLVIDGGVRQNGEITSANVAVAPKKITVDTSFITKNYDPATPLRDFSMEVNVIEKVTDPDGEKREINLDLDNKLFKDVPVDSTKNWSPIALENNAIDPNKEYTVNIILFNDRGSPTPQGNGTDPGMVQHIISMSTFNMKVTDIAKKAAPSVPVSFTSNEFKNSFFKNSGVAGSADIANGSNLEKIQIKTLPDAEHGVLRYDGVELTSPNLEIAVNDLPKLQFIANAGFTGPAEFDWNGYGQGKYAVADAKVTITLNEPPVVAAISKEGKQGEPVLFTPADFTEVYSDPESEPLTAVKIVTLPANGKLVLGEEDVEAGDIIPVSNLGQLKFVPNNDFSGSATFNWNGSDGNQYAKDDKTVTMTINAPPIVQDISRTAKLGTEVAFAATEFKTKFTDADEDQLQKIQVTLPADFGSKGTLYNGTTALVPGTSTEIDAADLNNLKFVPANGLAAGTAVTFQWKGSDGKHYSVSPATVTINYKANPTAASFTVNMYDEMPDVAIELQGADQETDADDLVYTIVSQPTKGTITADPAGPVNKWIYTPDSVVPGQTVTFTYQVTDEDEQTSQIATVTIIMNKTLDGWVGASQNTTTPVTAIPGQPLKLSAISTLQASSVTATVYGIDVPLTLANAASSNEDGYKLWVNNAYTLPLAVGYGAYSVAFAAKDSSNNPLPGETNLANNNYDVIETRITLTADPESILGDGKDTTELTALVTNANGDPLAGVEVKFEADGDKGTFVGGNTAVTNAQGIAVVTYQSEQITGVASQIVPVTAKVLDTVRGLFAEDGIQITFLPAMVQGILTEGLSNTPVANAEIRVTLVENDVVVFDETVRTDEHGAYSLPVPKGNTIYDLAVTRNVEIGGVETPITYNQKAQVGTVTGGGDEIFDSEKTVTGLLLFKKPDGKSSVFGNNVLQKTKVYLKDANGDYIMDGGQPKAFDLNAQGVFNASGLAVGEYAVEVRYEYEPGKEATISSGSKINVAADGELNIVQELVDPYGTITNAVTNAVIEGAKVTLYYADTARNKPAKTPHTGVVLPALVGFDPNNNASPEQLSDANGFYAYMVYPETDYYIVVTKPGFYTYTSPIISVEWDIVKHDVKLNPISPVVIVPAQPALAISVDKNIVPEGSQSTVTVEYKNPSTAPLNAGEISITLPKGVQVIDADGGTVDETNNTITWKTGALPAGQSGSYKVVVKWPQLTEAETELEIPGYYTISGSSSAVAAKASAKLKVFSDKFGELRHQRYILGFPDGEFKLGHSMTRAELAAIVARLTENQTINTPLPFSDIRKGHWATNYIRIAVKHGYFSGFADGTFRPDQEITRGELASVMARFLKLEGSAPVNPHFTDVKGHWAENAIEALYLGHYINGYKDGTFKPNNKIRRDEAITMINRMLYRGPLLGLDPIWPDVPADHWSFGDVQEATVSHDSIRNADGSETFKNRIEDDVQ